jgi:hypothetical protein
MNEEKLECGLGADWLPVIDFDLEAQVFDHAPDLGGRLARCREVAVYEDGIGWVEGKWLEGSKIMLAAAGDADFGMWVKEAEEAEDFQAALRGKLIAML